MDSDHTCQLSTMISHLLFKRRNHESTLVGTLGWHALSASLLMLFWGVISSPYFHIPVSSSCYSISQIFYPLYLHIRMLFDPLLAFLVPAFRVSAVTASVLTAFAKKLYLGQPRYSTQQFMTLLAFLVLKTCHDTAIEFAGYCIFYFVYYSMYIRI